MDSTIDIRKLRDNKVLDTAGKAIAEGIAVHFKLKKKATAPKPAPATSAPKAGSKLYKVQIGAFSDKRNADALAAKAKKAGFDTYIVEE